MKAADKQQINIYKVKNLVNGKCYIGQTSKSVAARLSQHWHSANVLNLPNPFHKAIRKYGKDAFAIETVVVCEQKMADYYEHCMIALSNSYASTQSGYNVANPLDHFRSIVSLKGEDHPMAKLKESDVIAIRKNLHLSNFEISKMYGITCGHVKKIRSGKVWKCAGKTHHFSEYKKDRACGERHYACVVSDEIRAIIKADITTNTCELAKRYGLDKGLIPKIRGPQPQIKKASLIDEKIAQYVLDNPEISNSKLSKITGISIATISRIKTGKQFGHLVSNANRSQWSVFFDRQKKAIGG